ncbi:hypothetical protein ACJX0J_012223, partial [Zea mays]
YGMVYKRKSGFLAFSYLVNFILLLPFAKLFCKQEFEMQNRKDKKYMKYDRNTCSCFLNYLAYIKRQKGLTLSKEGERSAIIHIWI